MSIERKHKGFCCDGNILYLEYTSANILVAILYGIVFREATTVAFGQRVSGFSWHYFLQPRGTLQSFQNKKFNENMAFKGYLLHREMLLLQQVKKQSTKLYFKY